MYLETMLVSVGYAVMRGGRLQPQVPFRHGWLPVVAFAVQWTRFWRPEWYGWVQVGSYGAMGVFLVLNLRLRGMAWLLGGLLLNLTAMLANGGLMPVDIARAQAIGLHQPAIEAGRSAKHTPLAAGARLPWLADVIPVPFPRKLMISFGDIVASCGVFMVIQEFVLPTRLSSGQGRIPTD